MKIAAINKQTQIEDSKLFGEVYLPDKWLEDDIFSPFEFFLCQIDVSKFEELPIKVGYLYFFIDAYNLTVNKMTAKVRYSKEEPDAYTDFNDGYFDDDPNEFLLTCEREGDVGLFESEQNSCLGEQNSHLTLLSVPTRYLPFDIQEGTLKFKIEKNKLEKLDFSACYLEFCK